MRVPDRAPGDADFVAEPLCDRGQGNRLGRTEFASPPADACCHRRGVTCLAGRSTSGGRASSSSRRVANSRKPARRLAPNGSYHPQPRCWPALVNDPCTVCRRSSCSMIHWISCSESEA